MLLFATFETKTITTLAVYDVLGVVLRDPLCCKVALLSVRAPLDILVVVRKRLAVPTQVPVQDLAVQVTFRIEKLQIHRMRHNDVAAKLLAAGIQTLFRVSINVDLEPFLPAASAELVAAHKLHRLCRLVACLLGGSEVSVAHSAVASIVFLRTCKESLFLLLGHRLYYARIE